MTVPMASSFLRDILTQKQPEVQTHQALLVLGLQNDFLLQDGKLPIDTRSGFLSRIKKLIPIFRENAGDVIWVRTIFEADRSANDPSGEGDTVILDIEPGRPSAIDEDAEVAAPSSPTEPSKSRSNRHAKRALDLLKKVSSRKLSVTKEVEEPQLPVADDELFLSKLRKDGPCFSPTTTGAHMHEIVHSLIDKSADILTNTSHYSAFNSTTLLLTMRTKLVTDLYICGCLSNISVFATALDAAKHGLNVTIISDCLGYRNLTRHEEAVKQLKELLGAFEVTSEELLDDLAVPLDEAEYTQEMSPTQQADLQSIMDSLNVRKEEREKREEKKAKSTQGKRSGGNNTRQVSKSELRKMIDARKEAAEEKEAARKPAADTAPAQEARDESPQQADSPSASQDDKPGLQQKSVKQRKSRIRMRQRSGPDSENDKKRPATSEGAPPPLPDLTSKSETSGVSTPQALRDSDHNPQTPDDTLGDFKMRKKSQTQPAFATLGPDATVGEGDSSIRYNFISPDSDPNIGLDTVFAQLEDEVSWQKMSHAGGEVPRLVCMQGDIAEDGSMPVYRHPSDQSLPLMQFSPLVRHLRDRAEEFVGHSLNHVLIQLYRSGTDFISEHSDKTLDIVRGSKIVNVSFGAQRTMRLRTKKSAQTSDHNLRQTQRIPMPHNSIFILGQDTNMRWLHGISADKRREHERTAAEKAFDGKRISLTFRHIGTFLDSKSERIWGQGATAKTGEEARPTINGDEEATQEIINAFGKENHDSEFDWKTTYGKGFDILHFRL